MHTVCNYFLSRFVVSGVVFMCGDDVSVFTLARISQPKSPWKTQAAVSLKIRDATTDIAPLARTLHTGTVTVAFQSPSFWGLRMESPLDIEISIWGLFIAYGYVIRYITSFILHIVEVYHHPRILDRKV
mmetsp:Transcript_11787/g.23219  ORF Transcript_11787/g.23219 Transcript_11787/m.23219 type:complete len:129 (+) Transcript_11787:69-455(+)